MGGEEDTEHVHTPSTPWFRPRNISEETSGFIFSPRGDHQIGTLMNSPQQPVLSNVNEVEQLPDATEQATANLNNTRDNDTAAPEDDDMVIESRVSGPRLRKWQMSGTLMQKVIEETATLDQPVTIDELTDPKSYRMIGALNAFLNHEIDYEAAQIMKDQILATIDDDQSPSHFDSAMRANEVPQNKLDQFHKRLTRILGYNQAS